MPQFSCSRPRLRPRAAPPIALAVLLLASGCATNPVTGRQDLRFMSDAQERSLGDEHYPQAQQSQGGLYRVDPALSAYVNEVGQRIARVSDRPLDYEFVVLNNGVPNAWALPGGKIAVNRGLLLELADEAELAAVLGHEVVHAAAGHGARAVARGQLLQGAVLAGAIAARNQEAAQLIVGSAQVGAQLISQRFGRDAERESDHFGILYMLRAGYDPRAAVSLQETFVRLAGDRSPGWLEGLFSSHPPSEERVRNNQILVDELLPQFAGRELERGAARYQEAIAILKRDRPAYDRFEEARGAMDRQDHGTALRAVDEAIGLVPAEARFHGLKGDILAAQGRFADALPPYDEALRLDDRYHGFLLGRGTALARLSRRSEARADLEQSARLLPTAAAMNELGRLSLAEGDRARAKEYFRTAAAAGGVVGAEAEAAFLQLDLADQPARHVDARAVVDEGGRILVRLGNRTSLPLREVRVQVEAVVDGTLQRRVLPIARLAAGSSVDIDSGLALPAGLAPAEGSLRVTVLAAQL